MHAITSKNRQTANSAYYCITLTPSSAILMAFSLECGSRLENHVIYAQLINLHSTPPRTVPANMHYKIYVLIFVPHLHIILLFKFLFYILHIHIITYDAYFGRPIRRLVRQQVRRSGEERD